MTELTRNDFEDKQLVCIDCEATFIFTKGEQFYYAGRGLTETKRCPACRLKRKLTLAPPEVRQ